MATPPAPRVVGAKGISAGEEPNAEKHASEKALAKIMPTVWESSSARRVGGRAGGLKCSPTDKCCGCCCPIAKGVQLGAITLCVLAIYSFAAIFHDSGMAGGRMYLATDDREARRADSFCELSESAPTPHPTLARPRAPASSRAPT